MSTDRLTFGDETDARSRTDRENIRAWNDALASGLVVEEGDEWRIGPRADAITTPADGPHMAAARDALDEARLTLRLASLPAR